MDKREKLFEKFPPVSTEKWMEKITTDLKGADFNKKLVWKTGDGLNIMPFYRQEDLKELPHCRFLPGDFPYIRGMNVSGNTWLVRQDIIVKDYKTANNKAIDLLGKGVSSIGFVIENSHSISPENISYLLRGIPYENVEINFTTKGMAKELIAAVTSVVQSAGKKDGKVRINISADPLGRLAAKSKLCTTVEEGIDYLADMVKASEAVPGMKCIEPSGVLFINAGVGPVAELAFTLSLGNEYMALLTSRGIKPDMAADAMRFTFGTGPDFFPEIAKIRAARMLWAVIVKAYGNENEESALMHIHSVTGRWNKTLYDPYVNMLRTQTEAMSAALGGAESITVEPFDTVFRSSDEFSERIARNQQLLLMEESHLDKVADPGAGSYYIEELTSIMATEAWKLFLEIEDEGGFLEALRKGIIQKKISDTAVARMANVARRKEILLGTNQYPDFRENKAPEHDYARLFGKHVSLPDDEVIPILTSRGAEEFEMLRLATEKAGHRPVVFMLTIGNLAMRRARAQFASNFFAVAGYEVKDNNGFESSAAGVKAALDAKADIIVICSSDDEYATVAKEVFVEVKGRAVVVVAGNPPCMDDLKSEGIEHFISIRSNVLETMQMFNTILGIN